MTPGSIKKLLSVLLIFSLMAGLGMTAYAEEVEEKTPTQIEMERVNAMPTQTDSYTNWPEGPGTYGEAAIVMEAGTGAILYAKNIETHLYPASITKVLTALVALENGKLTDTVSITRDCVSFLEPGDAWVGLKEGNEITLEDAMYAMLLASGNEAAYAIAESVGVNAGHDYNWFIEQMNAKCKEIGAENSNFLNSNGLHDDNHYTCAKDMALIGSELFKYPEFLEIESNRSYTIEETEYVEAHPIQQNHKMLYPQNSNYYEYAVAGKTGYTDQALSTLITMADNGQMQLVCVVLHTYGRNVYPDTRNLFEYGFNNFAKVNVVEHETSKDIKEILTDESGGYVVLPSGVEFSALNMEIVPDEGDSESATLIYTYEGNKVGQARAVLTDDYLKSIGKKQEAPKLFGKKTSTNSSDGTEANAGGIGIEKMILIGLLGLLVILVLAFVIAVIRVNRIRKRKKALRQRKKKED